MLHLTTLTSRLLLSLFRRDWAIGLQLARSSLSLSRAAGRGPRHRSTNQSTASSDISSADDVALRFKPVDESIFPRRRPRIWEGSPIVAVVRLERFRVSKTFPTIPRKLAERMAAAIFAQAEKSPSAAKKQMLSASGEHSDYDRPGHCSGRVQAFDARRDLG
jgi:hypothetical protein